MVVSSRVYFSSIYGCTSVQDGSKTCWGPTSLSNVVVEIVLLVNVPSVYEMEKVLWIDRPMVVYKFSTYTGQRVPKTIEV